METEVDKIFDEELADELLADGENLFDPAAAAPQDENRKNPHVLRPGVLCRLQGKEDCNSGKTGKS